jgi:glycosyltransferase involved in cell wall biosynthesis
MNAQPHRISVVIPTSGRASLAAVREGITAQSVAPQEICVIEDRDRRGPGWARNRGIERSSGDIIALLDDDTVPPPEWLASMISALDETGADCAGGSFIESDPLLNDVRTTRPLPCERILDGLGLVGNSGNLVLRRPVVDAMRDRYGHVFIESWGRYGSEDWELIMRIRDANFRLVYVPVHVLHLRRVTVASYMRHQFLRGIGVALLHQVIRRQGLTASPQQSILWDPERSRAERLLSVLKVKVLGPLNAAAFRERKHFAIHWIAEKFQGLGYIWGVIRHGR